MKEVISIKGERKLWTKFVNKLRDEKKEVWEVLSLLIKDYLKKGGLKDEKQSTNIRG